MASLGSTAETDSALLAVVEGGGTSFRVAICRLSKDSSRPPEIVARDEFDSSHKEPKQTLEQCAAFFEKHKPLNRTGYAALGIATFGPVGINESQPESYGRILPSSPKAVWRNVDFLTPLKNACQGAKGEPLPVLVETDVNAPALAEYLSAKKENGSISSASYITVGTGVGVGLVINGKTVHGRMHPEGGHVPVQALEGDSFTGYSWGTDSSPFHGKQTVEGIASTVALTERILQRNQSSTKANSAQDRSVLANLKDDDQAFDHAANALANLCATLLLMLSMEKIVLGGGLMNRKGLIEKIRKRTVELLNGYLPLPSDMSSIITTSAHGNDAGLQGAIVLAQHAFLSQQQPGEAQKIVENTEVVEKKERKMKQEAFNVGLWHGFIVGAISIAAVYQYFIGRSRRK
eukprot:CAMPEP_0172461180 /NCGR_PEP_ID=MMETSP1065-20121228/39581_1 /TAXON_ID=265537 /ORGANISM="Amphiprora paludosa, Strain CCMP125" /LENGTH=404 /DNA_ID=CAMNT_0013216421 /DNA_START=22 /DNA_END=1236 /DNA_ORIENTATION=+